MGHVCRCQNGKKEPLVRAKVITTRSQNAMKRRSAERDGEDREEQKEEEEKEQPTQLDEYLERSLLTFQMQKKLWVRFAQTGAIGHGKFFVQVPLPLLWCKDDENGSVGVMAFRSKRDTDCRVGLFDVRAHMFVNSKKLVSRHSEMEEMAGETLADLYAHVPPSVHVEDLFWMRMLLLSSSPAGKALPHGVHCEYHPDGMADTASGTLLFICEEEKKR